MKHNLTFEFLRLPDVIRIEERDERCAGFTNASVSSRPRKAEVLHRDVTNPSIAVCLPFHPAGGAVGRAVVDDDELEIANRLCKHRFNSVRKERLAVVGGDDDRDGGDRRR